jgi:hypothetical protein
MQKILEGMSQKETCKQKQMWKRKLKIILRIKFSFKGIARSPLQRKEKGIYGKAQTNF